MELINSIYYKPYKQLEKEGGSFADFAKSKNYYNQLGFLFEEACSRNVHTEKEAQFLIDLTASKGENLKFLDIACGTGRHARILSSKGYEVTGIDGSKVLISYAKKKDKLTNYLISDMREFDIKDKFDCIYSIWDAYVYLSRTNDMNKFINKCYMHLKNDGLLILDARNFECEKREASDHLEEKNFYSGDYKINLIIQRNTYLEEKVHEGLFIYKIEDTKTKNTALVVDQELVRTYLQEDVINLLKRKFEIDKTYGDFDINTPYNKSSSYRMIITAKKYKPTWL